MIDGAINDVRIVGIITNICLLIIALVGMSWESKVPESFIIIIIIRNKLVLIVHFK